MFFILCLFCINTGVILSNEERNLQNKLAVVTGAAQGIGYAIADNFLKAGVESVIILDKQFEMGMNAATNLNNKYGENRAIYIYCDVTKNFKEVSYRILNEYKYIDILVNDAGVFNELCPELTIDTNCLAVIQGSLIFWEHMRKDRNGRGGTIINLSSILGHYIHPYGPVYTASKYAVIGFSKSLGHEYTYRNTSVRVLTLCPGATNTEMLRHSIASPEQLKDLDPTTRNFPWQEPDAVGRGAVEVFENAESGTAWDIIGGNDPVEAPISITITAANIDSLP